MRGCFLYILCAYSHILQRNYKNTSSKLTINTLMPHSLIFHLIHRPFVSQWRIVWDIFSINQERIGSKQTVWKLRHKKPALIHITRQEQKLHYNTCLFFDKLQEENCLYLNLLSWLLQWKRYIVRCINILPVFVSVRMSYENI